MNNKLSFNHPRIAVRAMKEFITNAIDDELLYCADIGWSHPQVTIKKDDGFCAYVNEYDKDDSIIIIGYNFSDYMQKSVFYANFIERCPLARGFSKVTLALLHELGHFETYNKIPSNYNREKSVSEIRKKGREENISIWDLNIKYYFFLCDETLATEWAIKWISNPQNRKLAKAFEKKFFACVKK